MTPTYKNWLHYIILPFVLSENVTISCQLPKCGNKLILKKEVSTLTEPEKQALLAAFKAGIDQGEYSKLANFHGAPFTMCSPVTSDGRPIPARWAGCCPHGPRNEFLIWHRLLLTNLDHVRIKTHHGRLIQKF